MAERLPILSRGHVRRPVAPAHVLVGDCGRFPELVHLSSQRRKAKGVINTEAIMGIIVLKFAVPQCSSGPTGYFADYKSASAFVFET